MRLRSGTDWESIVADMVLVHSEAKLAQIAAATNAPGRFSRVLNCRKQKSDEYTDDANDDDAFDKCKRTSFAYA
jgi:hypothetical protein